MQDDGNKFENKRILFGIINTVIALLRKQPLRPFQIPIFNLRISRSSWFKSLFAAPPGGVNTNFDPTNRIWTFIPPANECIALSMSDASGGLLPKTAEGLNLGQPPSLDRSARNFQWDKYGCECAVLLPDHDFELYSLDPTKYFDIKNPGRYKLTLVQRIYVIDTNANLKPVELPPVSVDVEVQNSE
jgi:hypothetical protein